MENISAADLLATLKTLIWACGFVAAVWGAFKIVREIRKPAEDLRKKVEDHDEQLKAGEIRMDSMEEGLQVLISCNLAQIDHSITGNSVDKLKAAKETLTAYLIHRGRKD